MKQNTSSQRIVSELRARIRSGQLAPGDHVPSARDIVREHNVAIATATKVLAMLKHEGLVRVLPGVGTIVRGERGVELTRARIIQAAIAIADDEGTATLTMRTLARELGVATMSLYRHVRSREELILAMADATFLEQTPPRRARHPWRKQLELVLRVQWEGYRRHPWLAHVISMTRPQALKNGMLHTEAVLEALVPLGFDDETILRTAITLMAFVRGMAASLEQEKHAEQDSGISAEEWMVEQEASMLPLMKEYPVLMRMSTNGDFDIGMNALFECGLRYLVDGIGQRAKKTAQ
ncbi:MAG: TetR/AcrR family transcriptional regulator C-terminal domain-containing protein [Polyangiaceae bacterium]